MKLPPQQRSNASSNEYWTDLTPDRTSRCVFFVIASAAALSGGLLLLTADLDPTSRAALLVFWLLTCARGVWCHIHNQVQLSAVRVFVDGDVRLALRRGDWLDGRLHPGTLSLAAAAWLRIRTEDQRTVHLLLLRTGQRLHSWRRFQVICRHIGPRT